MSFGEYISSSVHINSLRWPEFKCIKKSLSIFKLHTLDYRHTGIETFAANEKCRKLTAKIGKKQQTYEVKNKKCTVSRKNVTFAF